jgi:hypothetical protein
VDGLIHANSVFALDDPEVQKCQFAAFVVPFKFCKHNQKWFPSFQKEQIIVSA